MKRKFWLALRLVLLGLACCTLLLTTASAKYYARTGINYQMVSGNTIPEADANLYNVADPVSGFNENWGYDVVYYTSPVLATPGNLNPNNAGTTNQAAGTELILNNCPAGWYAFEAKGAGGGRAATSTGAGGCGGGGSTVSGFTYIGGFGNGAASGTIILRAGKVGGINMTTSPGNAQWGGGSSGGTGGGGGGGYSGIFVNSVPGASVTGEPNIVAIAGGGGGGGAGGDRSGENYAYGGRGGYGYGAATGWGLGGSNTAITIDGVNGSGKPGSGGGGGGGGGTRGSWTSNTDGMNGNPGGELTENKNGVGTNLLGTFGDEYLQGIGGGGGGGRGLNLVDNTNYFVDGGGGGSMVDGLGGWGGPTPTTNAAAGQGKQGRFLQGGDGGDKAGGGGGGYIGGGGGSRRTAGTQSGGSASGGGGGSSYLKPWVYPLSDLTTLGFGNEAPNIPPRQPAGFAIDGHRNVHSQNGYVWIKYLGARYPGDSSSRAAGVEYGIIDSAGYDFVQ